MNFCLYFPQFVKFGIGAFHIMLLVLYEFRENRHREGLLKIQLLATLKFMAP